MKDETLDYDHSDESYQEVPSSGTKACYAVQDGSTFEVCGCNPRVWPFKLKLSSSGFIAYFVVMYKIVDTNSIHGACVTMKAV